MTDLAGLKTGLPPAIRAPLLRSLAKYAEPILVVILCELVATAFLLSTVSKAGADHFWIDEVLAVWTARLHSPADVISAIWNGAEFSPPTYDLFLHYVFNTFGVDRLAARLPSIIAVLSTAAILASIVWRRLGAVLGALTFGLVLNSFLFDFAIQARPYAVLMTFTSLALLVWSSKPERGSWWQAPALAFLLFACMSLHFYAVLTLAVFGLMELLWAVRQRRLRLPIWAGLAGGAGASMMWLPLMRHLSKYNDGDTTASDFFGAPTPTHLVRDVHSIFAGSDVFLLFVFVAVLIIGAAYVASLVLQGSQRVPAAPKPVSENEVQIAVMGYALLTALPLGFALATYITHVFVGRYALAASLGVILLFVLALRRVPYQRSLGIALLAVLCVLPMIRAAPRDWSAPALYLLHRLPAGEPVVVGDGDLYMELMESAEPALRSRLVYLRSPAGVTPADPSGEHQLERIFHAVRPDLQVKDPAAFFVAHPAFIDLARPGRPTDDLSAWFIAKGWVSGVIGMKTGVALFDINTSLPGRQILPN